MNLQVCAPHQECVYNCPFCVARGHKHKYQFKDIYNDGLNQDYFNALKRTIKNCNIDTVIITGECDPTQNMRWARKVAEVAKSCGVRTEIQTHNLSMKMEQLDFVDVVSYSITNAREYLSSWQCINNYHGNAISRMVIILTKELNFLNKNNFCRMGFDQVTFKSLNYGEDEKINKWIDENTIELDQFKDIVSSRNGSKFSIRLDTTCQNATGRYLIFRSDGMVYDSWETNKGIWIGGNNNE